MQKTAHHLDVLRRSPENLLEMDIMLCLIHAGGCGHERKVVVVELQNQLVRVFGEAEGDT